MTDDEMLVRLAENGISVSVCTPEEWLELAITCERFAVQCGRFDVAYPKLKRDCELYITVAALAERTAIPRPL